jgi:hypothetical protein
MERGVRGASGPDAYGEGLVEDVFLKIIEDVLYAGIYVASREKVGLLKRRGNPVEDKGAVVFRKAGLEGVFIAKRSHGFSPPVFFAWPQTLVSRSMADARRALRSVVPEPPD